MIMTRKDLNEKYSLNRKWWSTRHDDLLSHLQDYMSIKEIKSSKGTYTYEIEGDLPNTIPLLPRKSEMKQKKADYEKFTIAALGTEFKPNSKMRVARQAIDSFGYEKYSHTNAEAVAKRYVKEPFEKYGETDNQQVWVFYSTYEKISADILEDWRQILREEHIGEEEAANAFYKQEQGQDISKEKSYYKKAQERFAGKYNDIPILVKSWKVRPSD